MTSLLVLLRHGQSEWNTAGQFTGWANPDLTGTGEIEAARAGEMLDGHGVFPAEHGEQQFMAWRRSYQAAPPPLDHSAWLSEFGDPRYQHLPPEARPRAESLRDVSTRLLPYWYDVIVPDLAVGGCVLVVSHGNTLRALVKHLDSIPDDRIAELEIPNGIPLAYRLGADMRPVARGGRYLNRPANRP